MRRSVGKRKSRKLFKATAANTRAINVNPIVMRGGYRI